MKKLEIKLQLTTKSHLTIGSGENQLLQSADIVQLKRNYKLKKRVCIPATTFKGLLRSSAVQIAHFIVDENYCKTVKTEELSICLQKTNGQGCIVCDIFGAINKSSKLFCEDFYPVSKALIELQKITQTSIERNSGKTKKGSLFLKEQIPPNIKFKSSLQAINLSTNEEFLLIFALKNLEFCSFGNGNGLIKLEIKKIMGLSEESEKNQIITKLLKKMLYNEKS